MEKQKLSFKEISNRMLEMELPPFDMVVGIACGGIVPASMIAHQLNCDLKVISLNYRDDENKPRFDEPQMMGNTEGLDLISGSVLLVDDVSVSGKTLSRAKSLLPNCQVTTLVCKGKGDFVMFPEITTCVDWPWKIQSSLIDVDDTI
jgi:hypoxanthine phosphoribosyltransferase